MKRSKERRKSRRDLCADFVRVAWCDQQGRRISGEGVLEDVSTEGLSLNLDLPVPIGQTVHVHTKGLQGEAAVRYCELGDYGYLVGLELAPECAWDREQWRPKHLLVLGGLAD